MDAFIESLSQLLIEWGVPGLFISSFIAGSILPFSSEIVLMALIKLGLDPTSCLVSATLGNTIGGMTCFWMGHLGKLDWLEKYLHIKKKKVNNMQVTLQNKGSYMAFFSFVPIIGGVIVVTLGYMRSNVWLTTSSMFIGKLLRYIFVLMAIEGIIKYAF